MFEEARDVGAGIELETKAVESALRGLPDLPDGMYLSVNASPATLASDRFRHALWASEPVTAFAARTHTAVVAECVESEQELTALRVLGVGYAQGFHLAVPGPLASLTRIGVLASDVAGLSK